jgi:hypothetical protein
MILIWDDDNRIFTSVTVAAITKGVESHKYSHGAIIGSKLFMPPRHAEKAVVFDTDLQELSTLDVSNHDGTRKGKWAGCVVVGERVICTPADANCILIWNSSTNVCTSVSTKAIAKGNWKWFGPGAVNGNRVVFAPFLGTDRILELDIATHETSFITVKALAKTRERRWSGCVEVDGKLIFSPWRAEGILVHDAQAGGKNTEQQRREYVGRLFPTKGGRNAIAATDEKDDDTAKMETAIRRASCEAATDIGLNVALAKVATVVVNLESVVDQKVSIVDKKVDAMKREVEEKLDAILDKLCPADPASNVAKPSAPDPKEKAAGARAKR